MGIISMGSQNRAGLNSLLSSSRVEKALAEAAKPVAAQAKATCPVVTGETRDSIDIQSGVENGRAFARVVVNVPWAAKLCSRNQFLSKSLDAAR